MKFVIIILAATVLFSKDIVGQENFCDHWYIEPLLYNNQINDSNLVEYWENYWYYRSGDDTKLIPDSLQIVLDLIPSLEILSQEDPITEEKELYQLKSTLVFKYGTLDRSYNVISPKISDTIVLINKTIDLKAIYNNFIDSNEMGFSFYTNSIKLKNRLDSLDISIEDGTWDFEKRWPTYALNQIIINTYFINRFGKIACSSEFTLPINGAYNNPIGGKWQF